MFTDMGREFIGLRGLNVLFAGFWAGVDHTKEFVSSDNPECHINTNESQHKWIQEANRARNGGNRVQNPAGFQAMLDEIDWRCNETTKAPRMCSSHFGYMPESSIIR